MKKNRNVASWFIAGTALGFAFCSLLGRCLTDRPLTTDFKRFHQYINPNSGFYPTFSQALAQARLRLTPGKPLLIVAGDSVFFGEGQSARSLWSEKLSQYSGLPVINLALPGTRTFECGYWVYETLRSEGADVLLITDSMPSTIFEPTGMLPVRYMYFDARERGRLERFSDRDGFAIKHPGWTTTTKEQRDKEELRAIFNHYLATEELWTRFEYRVFGTHFDRTLSFKSMTPRFSLADPGRDAPPFDIAIKTADFDRFDHGVQMVRRFASGQVSADALQKKDFANKLSAVTRASVPEDMKSGILVCLNGINPLFLAELTKIELSGYEELRASWRDNFEKAGFTIFSVSELLEERDYTDFDHLTAAGGEKLARALAPKVVQMAKLSKRGK